MLNKRTLLGLLAILVLSTGCATAPVSYQDPIADPMEGFNRGVHGFNLGIDKVSLKPLAKGYSHLPRPLRLGAGNFLDNLKQLRTLANEVLQGKLSHAGVSVARFGVNSTVGIGGLFDPATKMGLPHRTEGFAQTLAQWQIGSGPYFVIPFFGPSTTRDAVGRLVDSISSPLNLFSDADDWYIGLWVLDLIDGRYRLLPAETALENSLDSYLFLREAYLQRMNYEIWDGNPPITDFEDEEGWDEDEEGWGEEDENSVEEGVESRPQ